jgi:CheY-like chemotaxis protein
LAKASYNENASSEGACKPKFRQNRSGCLPPGRQTSFYDLWLCGLNPRGWGSFWMRGPAGPLWAVSAGAHGQPPRCRFRLTKNAPMYPNDTDPTGESSWPTLLCIDDDPQISEAIRLRLRDYKVNVLCGFHGTHGFWQAMTEMPDLVITDLRMPQGRGDYIIECLRNNSETRDIPVVVLTGQRGPDVADKIRRLHVQGLLTKPVSFEQLLATIKQHIPLRPREPELAEIRDIMDDLERD